MPIHDLFVGPVVGNGNSIFTWLRSRDVSHLRGTSSLRSKIRLHHPTRSLQKGHMNRSRAGSYFEGTRRWISLSWATIVSCGTSRCLSAASTDPAQTKGGGAAFEGQLVDSQQGFSRVLGQYI